MEITKGKIDMFMTKIPLAVSSILCCALAGNAYSADSFKSSKPRQSKNPVIQALERHDAFSAGRDMENTLAYVLEAAQATPDYVKGFGSDRDGLSDQGDRYLPRTCRMAIEDGKHPDFNVVFWDGFTFDSTGTRPLIEGTNSSDVIIGTNFSDVIYGLGGADFICALGGDDSVFGDGKDWASIEYSDGYDFLWGGPGDDKLFGGGGNDFMYGGADNDALLGGYGADFLDGDVGSFFSGYDLPIAFHGDDFLVGMQNSAYVTQDVHERYAGQGGNDVVNDTAYDTEAENNIPAIFLMDGFDAGFTDNCYTFVVTAAVAAFGGCENVN